MISPELCIPAVSVTEAALGGAQWGCDGGVCPLRRLRAGGTSDQGPSHSRQWGGCLPHDFTVWAKGSRRAFANGVFAEPIWCKNLPFTAKRCSSHVFLPACTWVLVNGFFSPSPCSRALLPPALTYRRSPPARRSRSLHHPD